MQPRETLALVGDEALLADLPPPTRRTVEGDVPILHYVTPSGGAEGGER